MSRHTHMASTIWLPVGIMLASTTLLSACSYVTATVASNVSAHTETSPGNVCFSLLWPQLASLQAHRYRINAIFDAAYVLQQTFGTRHKINRNVRLHNKLLRSIVNFRTTDSQSE